LDGGYRKRLSVDLPRWRAEGWVTAEGEAAILASFGEGRAAFGMATILGLLGALLLGLGIIAFIGANWAEMPKLVRFGLLVAGLAVAYAIAGAFQTRGFRLFSDAALLLAGLVFAAWIALVGQTYHLSGDFADAILLFEVGIVGGAVLTRSTTLTALALVASGYWTWLVSIDAGLAPHWGGLALIVVAGAVATWVDSAFARIVAVLAFLFWAGVAIVGTAIRLQWPLAGALALAAAVALLTFALGSVLTTLGPYPRIAALGKAMLWPGLAALLLALGVLQNVPFIHDNETAREWLTPAVAGLVVAAALSALAFTRRGVTLIDGAAVVILGAAAIGFALWSPEQGLKAQLAGGAIVILAAVWAISLGEARTGRRGKTLGLFAFGLEVLYLYVVTLGTMMDTALAFLLGGVLFIALAFGLYRFDRQLAARAKGQAS
jgi:uncharacterized membrane protein